MISIAMATYNGEKYIKEQLDSILKQTVSDFELVICDDCSTDGTCNILEQYAEKYSFIKLNKNANNLGFRQNFLQAINLCTGDFIALCDQDDIWQENHLEILLANIGKNDLCGANSILVNQDNIPLGTTLLQSRKIDILPQTQNQLLQRLLYENLFQGAALMFRRSLLKKCGDLPSIVKFHDHWLALVAVTNNGATYIDKPILNYRQHGRNITQNAKTGSFEMAKTFLKNIKATLNMIRQNRLSQVQIANQFLQLKLTAEQRQIAQNALRYFEKYSGEHFRLTKCCKYFRKNAEQMFCTKSSKVMFAKFCIMLLS